MALLSMFLIVALIPLYVWRRRHDSKSAEPEEEEEEQQVFFQYML